MPHTLALVANIYHMQIEVVTALREVHIICFENLCVARCRHDYGLRTSLAEEIKGQMSIVTVFTRRFGPI